MAITKIKLPTKKILKDLGGEPMKGEGWINDLAEITYNSKSKTLKIEYNGGANETWVNVSPELFESIQAFHKESGSADWLKDFMLGILTGYDKRTLPKNRPHLAENYYN